jgi:hypothetical protein
LTSAKCFGKSRATKLIRAESARTRREVEKMKIDAQLFNNNPDIRGEDITEARTRFGIWLRSHPSDLNARADLFRCPEWNLVG